jgi:hypothetical protein
VTGTGPRGEKTRRLVLALVAVALGGAALWLFPWRAGQGPSSGAGVAVELPTPRGGGRPPPTFRDLTPPVEPSVPSNGPGPHFAYYQGRSGRLAEGLTPTTEDPATKLGATGEDPALEVWVPSIRVLAAGTPVLARLTDSGTAGPLVIRSARVGYSTSPRELPAATETMTKVAEGPTSVEFQHHFVPPAPPPAPGGSGHRTPPPRFFRYQVVIEGSRAGVPFDRRTGGIFYVHDPGAQLQPASAVLAPADGDLRLQITADVKRAGTYFLYAELWGGKDGQQPIAFARDRLSGVDEGQRPVELRFGGRILREAGIDGPYVVRNLRLQQVDTHPAHEADPIRALPPSPAWPASSFR